MRVVCVKCQVAMRPADVGIPAIEMYMSPPKPYRAWFSDVYRCPKCRQAVAISAPQGVLIDPEVEKDILQYKRVIVWYEEAPNE